MVLFSGVILFVLCIFCKILMKLDKEFEDQLKKEVKSSSIMSQLRKGFPIVIMFIPRWSCSRAIMGVHI